MSQACKLTGIHVATMIATKSPSASTTATHVASSTAATHVGRRWHFIVHGATHSKTRVMLLKKAETSYTCLFLKKKVPPW